MNTQIFEQICQLKRQILPNEKVILFGSQARGNAKPDSDWDLLVLLDKDKKTREDTNTAFLLMNWAGNTVLLSTQFYTQRSNGNRGKYSLFIEM